MLPQHPAAKNFDFSTIKTVTSAAAPLSAELTHQIASMLPNADIAQGYGMTENAACCTAAWETDPGSGGSAGMLLPVVEMKLVDLPELGYHASDKPFPRGELLMRGASRFVGYYKGARSPPGRPPLLSASTG